MLQVILHLFFLLLQNLTKLNKKTLNTHIRANNNACYKGSKSNQAHGLRFDATMHTLL